MRRRSHGLASLVLALTLAACAGQETPPAPENPAAGSGQPSPSPSESVVPPDEPKGWDEVFEEVSSGVVRIDASNCEKSGTGTGFLIAPNLVATVAHVVEGAGSIRVTAPAAKSATAGRIVGLDRKHDLALVKTFGALPGHSFEFDTDSRIGMEMIVLGFPLGRSLQLTTGTITGTNDLRYVGDEELSYRLSDVLLTDAAMNPGNSGGPWVSREGKVVALAESGPPYDPTSMERAQGNNGGVSAEQASEVFETWKSNPEEVPAGGCADESVEDQMIHTLDVYFRTINKSDYASAYAQRGPTANETMSLDDFVEAQESSEIGTGDPDDALFEVRDTGVVEGEHHVDVSFVSLQDADKGQDAQTCTRWELRYTFEVSNGLWLIRRALPIPGTPGDSPC